MSPVKYELIQIRDLQNLSKAGLQISYPANGVISENHSLPFLFGQEPQTKIRVFGSGRVRISNIFNEIIDIFEFSQKDSPIVIRDSQTGQVLTLNYYSEPAAPTLQLTPKEIESLKNYK
jgi:hypothetical protein